MPEQSALIDSDLRQNDVTASVGAGVRKPATADSLLPVTPASEPESKKQSAQATPIPSFRTWSGIYTAPARRRHTTLHIPTSNIDFLWQVGYNKYMLKWIVLYPKTNL